MILVNDGKLGAFKKRFPRSKIKTVVYFDFLRPKSIELTVASYDFLLKADAFFHLMMSYIIIQMKWFYFINEFHRNVIFPPNDSIACHSIWIDNLNQFE